MLILLVESDPRSGRAIQRALECAGATVESAGEAASVGALENSQTIEAVVLRDTVGHRDGQCLVRAWRERGHLTPVLVVSERAGVAEKIEALECGADDFLTSPYSLDELVARVRALVRRARSFQRDALCVGDLRLEPSLLEARRGERRIDLSRLEYRLLEFLMRRAGQVCDRSVLIGNVWGLTHDPGTNIVDVLIRRVRRKVDDEDTPDQPQLLRTVRGGGYKIEAPTLPRSASMIPSPAAMPSAHKALTLVA